MCKNMKIDFKVVLFHVKTTLTHASISKERSMVTRTAWGRITCLTYLIMKTHGMNKNL